MCLYEDGKWSELWNKKQALDSKAILCLDIETKVFQMFLIKCFDLFDQPPRCSGRGLDLSKWILYLCLETKVNWHFKEVEKSGDLMIVADSGLSSSGPQAPWVYSECDVSVLKLIGFKTFPF